MTIYRYGTAAGKPLFSQNNVSDVSSIPITRANLGLTSAGAVDSVNVSHTPAGTGAVAITVQDELRSTIRPVQYGAIGNNIADDTAALNTCFAASQEFGIIDLNGKTYRITAPIQRPAKGVCVRNGRIRLDNMASNQFYALVANDFCDFDDIYFLGAGVTGSGGVAKYQGGVFGGNTAYAAPMNTAPANYVSIRGCTFDSLTVGAWSGGDTLDAVPKGWKVIDNDFLNIVGLPGLSEGYGVLFTPSNSGHIIGNNFETIRRHAIYIAGEATGNNVSHNHIDGCDNIAIQSNTFATQNYADKNTISKNIIRGLTRSIAYGYRSSIGIGIYGKFSNVTVDGNEVYDALDTGIDFSGELAATAYGFGVKCTNNIIDMPIAATDAGMRFDGILDLKTGGNKVKLRGAVYGVAITSNQGTSSDILDLSGDTLTTTNSVAQAYRIVLAAPRVVNIFRNTLNGFNTANYAGNILVNSSTSGSIRTDLNQNTGYYSPDADFTHYAFGPASNTDCPNIRHAATLTAARNVVLDKVTPPLIGAKVTIMRPGGGAFVLNIVDGGVIKALSTGQWGSFAYNGNGWELTGYGTL